MPEKLAEPAKWSRSKNVFVNSMSDLFHKDIPQDYIEAVLRVMTMADWHHYQVLTKRSERLRDSLTQLPWAAELKNVIWGVSVENRKHGLPRIAHLSQSPARLRFLSIEPLLEDLGPVDLQGIDWVIVGGESGAGSRFMEEAWVLSLLEQCVEQDVPFFFKQWGGWNKKKNGRLLKGTTWDGMPEGVVTGEVPSLLGRRKIQKEIEAMAQRW